MATPLEFEDSPFKITSPFYIDLTIDSSLEVQWVSCRQIMLALVFPR